MWYKWKNNCTSICTVEKFPNRKKYLQLSWYCCKDGLLSKTIKNIGKYGTNFDKKKQQTVYNMYC